MKTIKRFIAMILCISLCMSMTQAQPASDKRQEAQTTNTIAQDVLIIIQHEQVRFTAQNAVAEMQLQVFDQAGQLVHDSGVVTVPELIWNLRQYSGESVKSGLYAYTLSLKESGAADTRVRRGHFIVDRAKERDGKTDRLWITSQNDSGVGTELTVARNEDVTIAGTSATSEHKSAKTGDKEQPDGIEELKTESESGTKGATFAPSAVTGKTTIQGSEDPLLEIDHTGAAGHPAIWFKQDGDPKAYLWWDQFNNSLRLGTPNANPILSLMNNGNVGIGTTNPISKLHVLSGASNHLPPRLESSGATTFAAGFDFYHGATGKGYVGVPGSAAGVGSGEMLLFGAAGTKTSLWAGGGRVVTLDTNGKVGIGTDAPSSQLEIAAQDGLKITGYQPFLTLSDSNAGWSRFRLQNVNGGLNFQTHDQTVNGGSAMYITDQGNVGIGTTNPWFKLDVNGNARAIYFIATGGSDIAENFDVNVATTDDEGMTPKVEAGMVVSIDPASPGKLQISAQAYDRRVTGIISGAGGVRPGMVMGQEGTLADGKYPVALNGRVYCWVDASQGAIEPGDLLTTSSTPGHAMKAADTAKAQGAIIGKAMTGLKGGKGLVLVLVTLQ